jgi:arylsulfatase A-like enzyme
MSRRSLWPALTVLALIVVVGVMAIRPEVPSSVEASGDVVLIVVDTLRRDRLQPYGYDRNTSPELQRLADESTVYTQAMSQAPWTLPSIAATLTSHLPSTLGITGTRHGIPDDATMLSETMKRNGYATIGVVSHSFCSSQWNFDQGFDTFDESNILGHDAITSAGVTDRAIELMAQSPDRPVFLLAHYFDPHFAYLRHDQPWAQKPADYRGVVKPGMSVSALRKHGKKGLSDADRAELDRIYDSEVAHTDEHIGRLLDWLRTHRRYDEAMVIVTHDHGEEFWDHGRLGHTTQLWGEVIHSPLIVKYPHQDGARNDVPVGLTDVFPTIVDVFGLTGPSDLLGTSLRKADPSKPVYSETRKGRIKTAVRLGNHKLVHDASSQRTRVFDLIADPYERHPLAAELIPDEVLSAHANWPEQPAKTGKAVELSDEDVERLRALGYIHDDD